MRCQESAGVLIPRARGRCGRLRKAVVSFSARRLLNSPHSKQGLSIKRAPSKMSVASKNPFALLEGLYVSSSYAEANI